MYNYNYKTTITLPLSSNNETVDLDATDIDDLCVKLNYFFLEKTGLDELVTKDKLQNYLNGRSKYPRYFRNIKIIRS